MQRRLNGLGFDTNFTGKFDDDTRSVIRRWQAARGYPNSGFFNNLQHKALLSEIVATTPTASSDDSSDDRLLGMCVAPVAEAVAGHLPDRDSFSVVWFTEFSAGGHQTRGFQMYRLIFCLESATCSA
jgi:peptidoglycan hydrolase-like protein with peptidoglycan-binding domain